MKLTTIPLADIEPDPDNIRDSAAEADIPALAADIKQKGLLQPLVVYPTHDCYMVSGGHRRRLALLTLGWTTTDALVIPHPGTELERIDLMASENLHRRQLNPIEEARVYKRYIDTGMTQAEVARRLGVTQSRVSDYLQLLTLSVDAQRRILTGQLGVNTAKRLAQEARAKKGQIRPDYGRAHKMGIVVPYFTSRHQLYGNAAARCRNAEHDPDLRLGGACGECWEHSIRLDAARNPIRLNEPDPPPAANIPRPRRVEMFSDPRDILRRIQCTRCGIGALERPSEQRCFAVRDGRRRMFDRHEFPMQIEVAADA